MAMVIATFAASANSIRYFTERQAIRVASALDAENELMIYCGYEYELATYVIINQVWMERVNSTYYEIWLYGYDAYTGEEIYMPIDLACIWLYNPRTYHMYSAAQYLRFRGAVTRPNFFWTMPPYNSFTRHYHDPMYNHMYTYHYHIHRYGWRPPYASNGHPYPLHPYYMRTPSTPAPVPPKPFTPGIDYPITPDGHGYLGSGNRINYEGTRSTNFNTTGGARSDSYRSNTGNPGTTNRNVNSGNSGSRGTNTSTNTGTSTRGTSATPSSNTGSRGTNTTTNTGTSTRGTSATPSSNTGSRGTNTSTNTGTSSRGTSTTTNTGTSTRGSATNNTSNKSSRSGSSNTSSESTGSRGTSTTTSTSSRSNATTNRGSSNSR